MNLLVVFSCIATEECNASMGELLMSEYDTDIAIISYRADYNRLAGGTGR